MSLKAILITLGILVGVVLIFVIGRISGRSPSPSASVSSTLPPENERVRVGELDDFVERAQDQSLIRRIDLPTHEVQVNPMLWATLPADSKMQFAISLADYCAIHTHSSPRYVDIIDGLSAKKIASWGPSGFSQDPRTPGRR
jgi:hypothetical protein